MQCYGTLFHLSLLLQLFIIRGAISKSICFLLFFLSSTFRVCLLVHTSSTKKDYDLGLDLISLFPSWYLIPCSLLIDVDVFLIFLQVVGAALLQTFGAWLRYIKRLTKREKNLWILYIVSVPILYCISQIHWFAIFCLHSKFAVHHHSHRTSVSRFCDIVYFSSSTSPLWSVCSTHSTLSFWIVFDDDDDNNNSIYYWLYRFVLVDVTLNSWFGQSERALSTAIGSLANQLGIAIAFILSSSVVRQVISSNKTRHRLFLISLIPIIT